MASHLYKTTSSTSSQKIEVPMDPIKKLKLMQYHGVTNDYDLKLAIYREMLKKNRNKRG